MEQTNNKQMIEDLDNYNISISQFWKDFKQLPINQKLKFSSSEDLNENGNIRFLFKVESNNIITIREKDLRKVWLNKPKKDTIFKKDNLYILKNYLFDGHDLFIEVIQ